MSRRSTIEEALRRLAPKIPRFEADAVVDHAMDSPGLDRASPEEAAWLSLVAYVRHTLTEYDDLLADGYDVDSARAFVADEMTEALQAWGVRRKLTGGD
ncbi:MAG TPA: DUF2293 domain-containing protein [Geminicoccus sp.]|jgi:hypothetical protein|uniref:DUF2293 domain-containing protein n=1 Tax=Geminicoccus sp. TaxID=2024832 RepID=UPI002E2F981D|nr:DUF2293 domain-containing protein [Geminicoccus sp.]HEX2526973.1 DUF2293 domain-containing protein [Geminicoccus sp.]